MDELQWTHLIPDAPEDLGDWIALGDAVAKVIEKFARRLEEGRQDDREREAVAPLVSSGGRAS